MVQGYGVRMSSLEVKTAIREAWDALMPELPRFDIINATPKARDLPTVWAGLLFDDAPLEPVSIGAGTACWREIGTCTAIIMTQSGSGDATPGELALLVRQRLFKWSGLQGFLQIVAVHPPKDGLDEDPPKRTYFQTYVELDYVYEVYQ